MKMNGCMATLVLAFLSHGPLLAQDVSGTWQGTLQAGRELRIVIKISNGDDAALKALFYSIDQGGQGIPASTVSLQGSTVKIAVIAVAGTYTGRLSADGNSINGTWTQGTEPLPLNLSRATAATEWTIPEALPPPKVMAVDATPQFEVATIKPSRPDQRSSLVVNRSGMVNTSYTSLRDLITFAYGLHPKQVIGGPSWLESEKYDVAGKPDLEGIPRHKQVQELIQKLLADRFQLNFHREKRSMAVYAITVVKTAPKLTKNDTNPNGLPGFGLERPGALTVTNSTMEEFAAMLQANILDQPVVDHTGLSGRYNFRLLWTPDQFQLLAFGVNTPPPPPTDSPDAPPDLFTAFQQQLGLKLESIKAPADVLVIDHAEPPTSN